MANVTEDRQKKLQNVMSRAKKLIQLESSGAIDKIAAGKRDTINESLMDNASVNITDIAKPANNGNPAGFNTTQFGDNASRVPSAILESFSKNKIDESSLYASTLGSGGDLSFLTNNLGGKKQSMKSSEPIMEQVSNNAVQTSGSQVDYPMIRTIVEDIVRKYASSLNKKIISEGKESQNTLNTMIIGKSFKFLDQKGNIYECTMKKVGNINERKEQL